MSSCILCFATNEELFELEHEGAKGLVCIDSVGCQRRAVAGNQVVYGVPWIEVGFMRRPEGYKIFRNYETAMKQSKIDEQNGSWPSGGAYCGPERPVTIKPILMRELDEDVRNKLLGGATSTFTANFWSPPK